MNFKKVLSFSSLIFYTVFGYSQMACSYHPYVMAGADQAYLEIYLGIQTKSITYENGVGSIDYVVVLTDENEAINYAEKFTFTFQEDESAVDAWDVKRIGLDPGQYTLTSYIVDNATVDTLSYETSCTVGLQSEIFLSRPIICAKIANDPDLPFEKYGINYEKLAFDLVVDQVDELAFFIETSNLTQSSEQFYFIQYDICKDFRNPSMPCESLSTGYIKRDVTDQDFVVRQLDATHLASGNYHLLVSLIDKEKKPYLVSASNFQVMKPMQDLTTMAASDSAFETSWVADLSMEDVIYSLKAIKPQLDGQQREVINSIVNEGRLKELQYFLYSYWTQYSPTFPKQAYDKYMEVAKVIDRQFDSNVGYGFETDRGFYFLKYGKPDVLIEEDQEPSAPPYEIWIYNQIPNGETDVKFLFYNPSLAHNDYKILHSSSKFDVNNPDWQRMLYLNSPNEIGGTPIRGQVEDNMYRRAVMIFENF